MADKGWEFMDISNKCFPEATVIESGSGVIGGVVDLVLVALCAPADFADLKAWDKPL